MTAGRGIRAVVGVALGAALLAAATPAAAMGRTDAALARPLATDTGECTASTRITDPVKALGVLQSGDAWQITQGAGVTVAVVDSGVAANPHLDGAMAGAIDLVGDGAGANADLNGHGTAIAGQIAARPLDGSGVEGLAPAARILSVRVFAGTESDQVKAGFGPSVARLAAGIRTAADNGAQIINVSMSTATDDAGLRDAVAYAASRGSLVVASSGNRDNQLAIEENAADGARYPAGDPGAVGVAATDLSGVVTDASIHGPHVALAAPGQDILTTSTQGGDCIYVSDKPATSFATAYVSAAAALVAAAYPQETPAQWAYRLEVTAVRANPDQRTDAAGWGTIQPFEALVMVPGEGVRGPVSPFVSAEPVVSETPSAAVSVTARPPANSVAVFVGVIIAVLVAAALAIVGTLAVLRGRRRAGPHEGTSSLPAAHASHGLYGDQPGGR
ncbi:MULTISPECIES: S8 family serine peptidase [Microbacterium]|uniref:S8 family serine peptidase n=1 Tax=Microbacterium TaxID=33882 RepID=UPI0010FA058F|nr:S8 family serine peptidase [Microbacterium sp. 4NA327F11]MCK9913142.1 S8 family serine peptidase [Microbacteriaceae bacterium K1510]